MTDQILVATDLTEEALTLLKETSDVVVKTVAPSVQAVREGLKNANALIAREDVQIDAALLEQAPNLRIIARPATSVSNIDLESATRRGILVMNMPGISALADSEFTFMLMLALSRNLIDAHNSMKAGYWLLDRKRQAGTQLYGKTLGIVGFGRVGQAIAQRALSFGMTVLAYDPYVSDDQVADGRVILAGLRDLLTMSDFITIHTPLTATTHHLFNAERIAQMKPGARLINIAHGEILDEEAVKEALTSGHLGGVAVDVYTEEPPYTSPLIGLDKVIHTPHVSDNTLEATQDSSIQIVQQVLDALHDQDYRNVVNLPPVPGVAYTEIRPFLGLAERIGMLTHLLARTPIRRVAVEYRGDEFIGMVKPLTAALLKGLLAPILGDSISYVNAPMLANERGIQVAQVKNLPITEYTNLVTCQVTLEDGEEIVMAGTLLDRKDPHIIQINQYRMDFVPRGYLLVLGSYDTPGVIGRVGTLMANNNVNIASWQTGRAEPGGQTLTVLMLDEALPENVMAELEELDFVRHIHQIKL